MYLFALQQLEPFSVFASFHYMTAERRPVSCSLLSCETTLGVYPLTALYGAAAFCGAATTLDRRWLVERCGRCLRRRRAVNICHGWRRFSASLD